MILPPGVHQLKTFAQFLRKACRIVPVDGQSAAVFRAVDGKCSDDDMAAGPDRLSQTRHIGCAVRGIGQEMKGGAVVLNDEEDIRAMATGRDAVERLWDVCQVPDYRKIAPATHAELSVALVGGDESSRRSIAVDERGAFLVENLSPGQYEVRARLPRRGGPEP